MKKWMKYLLIGTGVSIAAVAVMVVIALAYEASLTPEEREQARIANAKRDSVAKVEKVRQDSIEAEKRMASFDTEAYIAAKDYVLSRIKFPKEADFPLTPESSTHVGNGVYIVRGTVEAKNAFGVVSDHPWVVSLKYTGGSEYSASSWTLVTIAIE
jgi:hypothetical protein